jgi:SP family general alpha glucoside:H+ symporter-like MFS transporter
MDVGLVNNFFGQTAYLNRFGDTVDAKGAKTISPSWQTGINNGQQAGAIVGLLFNGWAQSRFGSRRMYMFAMVLMTLTSESKLTDHGCWLLADIQSSSSSSPKT